MDIILGNISKSFGEKTVLQNLSAVIPEGKVTAIMAPSGVGKTTLLRLILGLEKPDSGAISGVPARCSAVFQEDRLCPELSVLGNIRLAVDKRVSDARIIGLLQELGLSGNELLPANQLSGGMARRVALARALLYDGDLLTLDEPFNGLDADSRVLAAAAVRKYAAGRTILLVTHRKEDLALLGAENIIVIE